MQTATLGNKRHKGVWIEGTALCKIARKLDEAHTAPLLDELCEDMYLRIDDRICEIFLFDFVNNRYFLIQRDRTPKEENV